MIRDALRLLGDDLRATPPVVIAAQVACFAAALFVAAFAAGAASQIEAMGRWW